MHMRATLLCFAFAALVCISPPLACAQEPPAASPVERVGAYGRINWQDLTALAVGVGVPPAGVYDRAKARAMAERAAILDARRNLLETLKGVRIDSQTTVQDFITRSDAVSAAVSGLIQGSTVQETTARSDGSWRAVVLAPLTGKLAELALERQETHDVAKPAPDLLANLETRLSMVEKLIAALNKDASRRNADPEKASETLPPDLAQDLAAMQKRLDATERHAEELQRRTAAMEQRLAALEHMDIAAPPAPPDISIAPPAPIEPAPEPLLDYTGLVVDARGLDFAPSLRPKLFGAQDQLYPGGYVNQQLAASRGLARYYRDLAKAQQNPDLGGAPLTVRAVSLGPNGASDLALDDADAQKLAAAAAQENSFLHRCKVVIVY